MVLVPKLIFLKIVKVKVRDWAIITVFSLKGFKGYNLSVVWLWVSCVQWVYLSFVTAPQNYNCETKTNVSWSRGDDFLALSLYCTYSWDLAHVETLAQSFKMKWVLESSYCILLLSTAIIHNDIHFTWFYYLNRLLITEIWTRYHSSQCSCQV